MPLSTEEPAMIRRLSLVVGGQITLRETEPVLTITIL